MRVVEVGAESTSDLRRRVLRGGRTDADVHFPEDDVEGAFHLAVVQERPGEDGRVVAVASFSPEETPHRPGTPAVRVRGMAVEPSLQRTGLGSALLDAAAARLSREGVGALWANGRDTALGFYLARGWRVEGEGFTVSGIPHHVVVLDLS